MSVKLEEMNAGIMAALESRFAAYVAEIRAWREERAAASVALSDAREEARELAERVEALEATVKTLQAEGSLAVRAATASVATVNFFTGMLSEFEIEDKVAEDPHAATLSRERKEQLSLRKDQHLVASGGKLPVPSVVKFLETVHDFVKRLGALPHALAQYISSEAQERLRTFISTRRDGSNTNPSTSYEWYKALVAFVDGLGDSLGILLDAAPGYTPSSQQTRVSQALFDLETMLREVCAAAKSACAADREHPSARNKITFAVLRRLPPPLRDLVQMELMISDKNAVPVTLTWDALHACITKNAEAIFKDGDDSAKASFGVPVVLSRRPATAAGAGAPAREDGAPAGVAGSSGYKPRCGVCRGRHLTHEHQSSVGTPGTPGVGAASPASGAGAHAKPAESGKPTTAAGGDKPCSNCKQLGHSIGKCTAPCSEFLRTGTCSYKGKCRLDHVPKTKK
jgi:hypothetical protein